MSYCFKSKIILENLSIFNTKKNEILNNSENESIMREWFSKSPGQKDINFDPLINKKIKKSNVLFSLDSINIPKSMEYEFNSVRNSFSNQNPQLSLAPKSSVLLKKSNFFSKFDERKFSSNRGSPEKKNLVKLKSNNKSKFSIKKSIEYNEFAENEV